MSEGAGVDWSLGSGVEPSEALPASLGSYRIEGELGRGGGGVVYRARAGDGRAVAVKTLLPGAPARLRERLLREAELAARLNHPGIVRLLERGEAQERPFVAYELVEGPSLARALPGLPVSDRARIVLEVARAVAHAHAQGIVHRDLKPENVLLDGQGRPRLIDFGVGAAEDLDRLTHTGALVGSPLHMSPEQLTGERALQGPPSDVWALGVLLFLALTGEPPFAAGQLGALRDAVLNGPTPSPRARVPSTTPALEAVCQRALARDPKLRHPDAGAFADDLERALEGADRARARPIALLAGLALLASLAGWAWRSASPPPAPAPTPSASTPGKDEGEQAWVGVLARPEPTRLPAVRGWLQAHPDHPRVEEARALARDLAWDAPLCRLGPWEGSTLVAFLPDGTLLGAGGGARGWVRQLSLAGPELHRWTFFGAVEALAVGGGDVVVSGTELVPTRLRPGREPVRLEGLAPSRALALDPAARWLALGRTGAAELVPLAGGAPRLLPVSGDAVAALAFAEEGALLLAGVAPGRQVELSHLAIWALPDGRSLPRQSSYDVPVALAAHGRLAAIADAYGHVLLLSPREERDCPALFDPSLPEESFRSCAGPGATRGLVFSRDGTRLYSLSVVGRTAAYQLRAWDTATGALLRVWPDRPSYPTSLALSPDGALLAVGTREGTVEVWWLPE